MSQTLFTHDTALSLVSVAALLNGPELATVAEVRAFCDAWGWTGRAATRADLEVIPRIRRRLRTAWTAPLEEAVELTNELLRDGRALPQLVTHEPVGWHIHATSPDEPFPVRLAVDTAMALVDVIRLGELERLRTCAAEGCEDLFVDLSRNRSRKFCEGTCGTRAHVAAYRARSRLAPGSSNLC